MKAGVVLWWLWLWCMEGCGLGCGVWRAGRGKGLRGEVTVGPEAGSSSTSHTKHRHRFSGERVLGSRKIICCFLGGAGASSSPACLAARPKRDAIPREAHRIVNRDITTMDPCTVPRRRHFKRERTQGFIYTMVPGGLWYPYAEL